MGHIAEQIEKDTGGEWLCESCAAGNRGWDLWVCLGLGWFTCEVGGAIKGQAAGVHLAT